MNTTRPLHLTNIDEPLHRMPERCAVMLRAGGITLAQRSLTESLWVDAAPSEIERLLVHIVRIACCAMPDGGVLHSLASAEGAQAVLRFMDESRDGSQPVLGRLFDKWSRIAAKSLDDDDGPVVSVAVCERTVHRHGGRIYAAPSPLGELGLTLRLPLSTTIVMPAAPRASSSDAKGTSHTAANTAVMTPSLAFYDTRHAAKY